VLFAPIKSQREHLQTEQGIEAEGFTARSHWGMNERTKNKKKKKEFLGGCKKKKKHDVPSRVKRLTHPGAPRGT